MTGPAQKTFAEASGQRLVLLGAGDAHLHMLSHLGRHPLPGVQVTLIAPRPRQLYSGMVPGFVAGHYGLDDCAIALEPLVNKSGIRWLDANASGLDAKARTVLLDDGSEVHFDWLSVNTGPVQNRDTIESTLPGAREHGLFVRPTDNFAALWPRVIELAGTRALRIAVIGSDANSIELAMAIRHRLSHAAVTLITGGKPAASSHSSAVQRRVMAALKSRKITVLTDVATAIQADVVHLGCGARLACDVPVIATSAQAPAWLADSGLTLDDQGGIAVDACQRSTSHARILATGDISQRIDRPMAQRAVSARRAGPLLTEQLTAIVSGLEPRPHTPAARSLQLLSCGNRYAIASWGNFSTEGHWVWLWKNWMDRTLVRQHQKN